jgi:hypothetical protein
MHMDITLITLQVLSAYTHQQEGIYKLKRYNIK